MALNIEAFNTEYFKNLMTKACDLTEATEKIKPVFENVPEKLREFASRTMDVLEAKAKVSFSSLMELSMKDMTDWKNGKKNKKNPINPLNMDLRKEHENDNIPLALNWVVKLLKGVIEKLDEQGDILRVHNEVLANPDDALDVSNHDMDALKKENDKLKNEIDETRQRGMKGNLIVSCPVKNGQTLAVHGEVTEGVNKRLETDAEMIVRLINEKSQVKFPMEGLVDPKIGGIYWTILTILTISTISTISNLKLLNPRKHRKPDHT